MHTDTTVKQIPTRKENDTWSIEPGKCVLFGLSCAALTNEKKRRLPVTGENRQIAGLISIGDLVKELILEQAFLIKRLANYIAIKKSKPTISDKQRVEIV